ncbi:MAG: EAL domain-containing protein [Armatimonadota bacterium]
MKLRNPKVVTIFLAIVALLIVVSTISRTIILDGYKHLEEQHMGNNVLRARDILSTDLESLGTLVRAQSRWDNTCNYMRTGEYKYIRNNLNDSTFSLNRLNLILYVNIAHRLAIGRAYDLEESKHTTIPKSVLKHLTKTDQLLNLPNSNSLVTGLMLLPEGPMQIASAPILSSRSRGPVLGYLVIGRYLNKGQIQQLTRIAHLDIHAYRIDDPYMPADCKTAKDVLFGNVSTHVNTVKTETSESIAGYTLIKDINWQPAMLLKVDSNRNLYQQGVLTVRYFLIWFFVIGLLSACIITYLLLLVDRSVEELRKREALRESEERFRELVANLPDVVVVHRDMKVIFVNDALFAVLGYRPDEMLGHDIYERVVPRDQQKVLENVQRRSAGEDVTDYEMSLLTKNGEERAVIVHGVSSIIFGTAPANLVVLVDITERKDAEEALRTNEQKYRLLAENVRDVIWTTDLHGHVTYISPSIAMMQGYSAEECQGRTITGLLAPASGVSVLQRLEEELGSEQRGETTPSHSWTLELQGLCKDGTEKWIEAQMTFIRDPEGLPTGMLGVTRDISERKRAEERMNYLAYYDGLTGLPNRFLFNDRMSTALIRLSRSQTQAAMMLVDLDRFKDVNDSLGHNTGDLLLKEVGQRLASCIRESDTVARMSGDEFVIVLADIFDPESAEVSAQRILSAFTQPFFIEEHEIFISPSIGITIAPSDGVSVDTLLKNADLAMYRAKEQGRNNYQFFSAEMSAIVSERRVLENHLRKALDHHELQVHYQPQLDLHSERIIAVEALVRWQHPELGAISPSQFIPLAEETGLIEPLGRWVLETACAQTRDWQLAGAGDLRVAVNLSARQFERQDLVETVTQVLRATDLHPGALELEITESTAMRDWERTLQILEELGKLGVRIAIDDFGTGHCSFGYLRQFPIDTLKIDRSFIQDLQADRNNAAIVSAIIVLAHALSLTLIAECVETPAQLSVLRTQGCDKIQGYLFSKPLPPDELARLLRSPKRALRELAEIPHELILRP